MAQKRVVVEYYAAQKMVPQGRGLKPKLIYRYQLTASSHDAAIQQARERARVDGRIVLSTNFKQRDPAGQETLVVYVEEGAHGRRSTESS